MQHQLRDFCYTKKRSDNTIETCYDDACGCMKIEKSFLSMPNNVRVPVSGLFFRRKCFNFESTTKPWKRHGFVSAFNGSCQFLVKIPKIKLSLVLENKRGSRLNLRDVQLAVTKYRLSFLLLIVRATSNN
jgi:hypothetical protein